MSIVPQSPRGPDPIERRGIAAAHVCNIVVALVFWMQFHVVPPPGKGLNSTELHSTPHLTRLGQSVQNDYCPAARARTSAKGYEYDGYHLHTQAHTHTHTRARSALSPAPT